MHSGFQPVSPTDEVAAALLTRVRVAVIAVDTEQRITYWNAGAERLYGWSANEVLGQPLTAINPYQWLLPGDEQQAYEALARTGEWSGENVHFTRDGSQRFVESSVTVLRDAQGTGIGLLALVRDITRRKEHEEALRQQARLLDLSYDAIFVRDLQGVISVWNEGAVHLYGWGAEEAQGKVSHVLLRTQFPPLARPIDELLAEEGYWEGELTHTRRDGRRVVVDSRQVLVRDAQGRPSAILETNRDQTARKQAEAERSLFVSMVTHDLRNLLAVISGTAQLAQRQAQQPEGRSVHALSESLQQISKAGARMERMVTELLDLSRLEAGQRLELNRQPTDLVALAQRVAAEQQETSVDHQLVVQATVPTLVGDWDSERLERVLTNLLSNAIKYSPAGGEIGVTISTTTGGEDGTWAELCVQDAGVGIPPEDVPYIFDRFHRGTNVVGEVVGFGLGLAAVKQVVEQHGGTIAVASELGKGSVFTVRLPLHPGISATG